MENSNLRQRLRDADFQGIEVVKVLLKSGELIEIEDVRFSHLNGGELHIIAGPLEDELEEKEAAEEESEKEFLESELGCPPGCTSPFCDCPGTK